MTFFGGEPLLNLPVLYDLAERMWAATQARGVRMSISIITNGLLLTDESSIGCCRTGCRASRSRSTATATRTTGCVRCAAARAPSTGSSTTSAGRAANVPIAIGGNFDECSADSYPALLDFLREQDFADKLVKVNFKPVVRDAAPGRRRAFCR